VWLFDDLKFALLEQAAPIVWQAFLTEDGKTYYFNEVTNKTQWDVPSEPFHPPKPLDTAVVAAADAVAGDASVVGVSFPRFTDEDLEREVFEDMAAKASAGNVYEVNCTAFKKMLWDLKLSDGVTWTETVEQHQVCLCLLFGWSNFVRREVKCGGFPVC
jgi:sugar lactone lactonase YvrE